MKKILLLFAFAISAVGFTQNDAETLLESVYQKMIALDNIEIDFNYNLYNAEADIRQETSGSIKLKGSLYAFDYMGIKQLFDGKNVITIIAENEEVTIDEKAEDDPSINPSELLNFYRDGYTYQMDITQTIPQRVIQYVKLTPINSDSEISEILLGIDKKSLEIYKMIQNGKNGTQTTITVNKYLSNQKLDPSTFTFNRSKYVNLGYYIIEN